MGEGGPARLKDSPEMSATKLRVSEEMNGKVVKLSHWSGGSYRTK